MEFILELLPPRLFAFVIAVLFIVGGVYVWQAGSAERAIYDAAVGPGSLSYNAEIRHKTTRSESSSGINDNDPGVVDVDYLGLSFEEENGDYRSVDARVERDEFDSVKVGDHIGISFHPGNPDYVVTPMTERPGLTWYRIGGGAMVLLGAIFILMILASYL
jgi:hypothetical protein